MCGRRMLEGSEAHRKGSARVTVPGARMASLAGGARRAKVEQR